MKYCNFCYILYTKSDPTAVLIGNDAKDEFRFHQNCLFTRLRGSRHG